MSGGRQTGILQVLTWCSLFVASAFVQVSACSYSSQPTRIGRNFSVQVVYQSNPVAGLQIELSTDPKGNEESHAILAITTNESGLSEFTNVKPGLYYISIKHTAFSQSIEILVDGRSTNSHAKKITFEWPGSKPLTARSAAGLLNAVIRTENPLNDQAHPTFGALSGAKLTLSWAVTGETIEWQTASESGAFGFQGISAGLYMLHVEMANNASTRYRTEDGYVPIEIDPSAEASTLNLFLYPGVCGSLGYENRQESATQ